MNLHNKNGEANEVRHLPHSYHFNEEIFGDSIKLKVTDIDLNARSCHVVKKSRYDYNADSITFCHKFDNVSDILSKRRLKAKDDDAIIEYYEAFAQVGFRYYEALKKGKTSGFDNLIEKIVTGDRKVDIIDNEEIEPVITIFSEEFRFSYEFLTKEPEYNSENLLGTKYSFIRKYPEQANEFNHLNAKPKIAGIFNYELPEVVNTELPFFEKLDADEIIEFVNFSEETKNNKEALLKKIRNLDYDILHISCHICHVEADYNDSYMCFGNSRFLLRELVKFPNLTGKLVFINGCHSAGYKPMYTSGFAKNLANDRNATSVICVDIDVPDILAAQMTVGIYESFIVNKKAINTSIFRTASSMIPDRNLGGFFYSVYGNTIFN